MKILYLFILLSIISVPVFAQEEKNDQPVSEKTFELREIIVRDKKSESNAASTVTDLDVKNSTKTNIIDIINEKVPSFYTPKNRVMGFGVAGSGSAVMSIRGIGKSDWGPITGLPILINGLDTTTSIMAHPIADMFAMKNIDRIEVLSGPQPVLYGSGALGGVVNIITKRQAEEGYQTELSASYGSYNTTDDYVIHSGKIKFFDYGVSYNFQRTDGDREQTTSNGTEVTSEYFNHNYTGRCGFEIGKNWYAGINSFYIYQEIHDPGPDGAATDSLETFNITRTGTSLNVLNNYSKVDGMIHVFYNGGHHEAEETATDTDSYEHDDRLYGVRIVESAGFFAGNKITAGLDIRKWGGTSKNPTSGYYFVDDKYLSDKSVFGLVEQRFLDAFTLNGGIRYTHNSEFGGYNSYQGGLVVNPMDIFRIHSSIARGFKLPGLRRAVSC